MRPNYYLRLDRLSAWVLYLTTLLFIISGYGVTKQIINPIAAQYLHDKLLPPLFFLAFVYHTGFRLHNSLQRWRVFTAPKYVSYYVLLLSFVLLTWFFWLYFR